ncbi:two-component sensor histidine kinase [Chitinimonas prasina]|uniref:histidine kinase n=1 Tax=Chitinimonas prasina TaxID=1434937 RepID=A0ABQ5YCE1_9NEIS|nr:ATP-binding protein [Chitinimonas prasina]GLR12621.1 two-component sensor histidine kinase [Chitinimonas prasina]
MPHTALLAILRRIVLLRGLTLCAYASAMLLAVLLFRWQLPLLSLGFICLLLLAYNGFSLWRLRLAQGGVAVSEGEIGRQLAMDICGHSLWLFFLGGATNPFTAWFLLPLTIAAASLPGRLVWPLTALTIACYSLLLLWYQPLPLNESDLAQAFFLHTTGMWVAFVAAALIVAGLVARIGQQLRANEQALAAAREAALRQQQVLGLAIQAAGAAHRLGTPLATLTLLTDELLAEQAGQGQLADDLRLMQRQLQACRSELQRLRAEADASAPQPADSAVAMLLEDWQVVRPKARLDYQLLGLGEPPRLMLDFALRQALLNLLDNAADASPDWQGVMLDWSAHGVQLDIADAGPGFDGKPVGDTVAGLGMGLALAISALERVGARLDWLARPQGGTCVRVVFPLEGR